LNEQLTDSEKPDHCLPSFGSSINRRSLPPEIRPGLK